MDALNSFYDVPRKITIPPIDNYHNLASTIQKSIKTIEQYSTKLKNWKKRDIVAKKKILLKYDDQLKIISHLLKMNIKPTFDNDQIILGNALIQIWETILEIIKVLNTIEVSETMYKIILNIMNRSEFQPHHTVVVDTPISTEMIYLAENYRRMLYTTYFHISDMYESFQDLLMASFGAEMTDDNTPLTTELPEEEDDIMDSASAFNSQNKPKPYPFHAQEGIYSVPIMTKILFGLTDVKKEMKEKEREKKEMKEKKKKEKEEKKMSKKLSKQKEKEKSEKKKSSSNESSNSSVSSKSSKSSSKKTKPKKEQPTILTNEPSTLPEDSYFVQSGLSAHFLRFAPNCLVLLFIQLPSFQELFLDHISYFDNDKNVFIPVTKEEMEQAQKHFPRLFAWRSFHNYIKELGVDEQEDLFDQCGDIWLDLYHPGNDIFLSFYSQLVDSLYFTFLSLPGSWACVPGFIQITDVYLTEFFPPKRRHNLRAHKRTMKKLAFLSPQYLSGITALLLKNLNIFDLSNVIDTLNTVAELHEGYAKNNEIPSLVAYALLHPIESDDSSESIMRMNYDEAFLDIDSQHPADCTISAEEVMDILERILECDNCNVILAVLHTLFHLMNVCCMSARKIILRLLLSDWFDHLFLHWSFHVRRGFIHLLLYRGTINRRSHLNWDKFTDKENKMNSVIKKKVNVDVKEMDREFIATLERKIKILNGEEVSVPKLSSVNRTDSQQTDTDGKRRTTGEGLSMYRLAEFSIDQIPKRKRIYIEPAIKEYYSALKTYNSWEKKGSSEVPPIKQDISLFDEGYLL